MKSSVSPFYKFKLTFVGILLAGLCWLMPTQSHSQSSIALNDFYDAPAGPYTTPAIALTRVEAQVQALKNQLANLVPGSQAYDEISVKYQFYSIILDELIAGKPIEQSLESALRLFGTDTASNLPKTVREAYKQEALNLLKP